MGLADTLKLLGGSGAVVGLLAALAVAAGGCATSVTETSSTSTGEGGSTSTTGTGGTGGAGGEGGGTGPCAQDCSTIDTPPCLVAVCNEGAYPGEVGACVVIDAPAGTACDDGLFCTLGDTCNAGTCVGGPPNDCGQVPPPCSTVTCNEATDSCGTAPADENSGCIVADLCAINGKCVGGQCVGQPKDCSFSPLSECNAMACNPATGDCEGTPDPGKDGAGCSLTGDLCMVGRTCLGGQCVGGTPKDCSALTVGCQNGMCNPVNGACVGDPVPPGGTCFDGIGECFAGTCDANSNCVPMATPGAPCSGGILTCNVGVCDAGGACQPMPVANGTSCNDYDSCTDGDTCDNGVCGGSAVANCQVYFQAGFEGGCPAGWTLGGDWECGTPSGGVGPATPHTGTGCIATQIDGEYNNNQAYTTATADSPPINLASASYPVLSFWTWINTEGSSFDGYNLKVSTDGGQNFAQVSTVTPAYALTINGEPAWGGDQSAAGWQNYLADLSAYAGQQIILRFAFRTDGSITRPGVYIDDIAVGEGAAIPLAITTGSPLADAFAGQPFAAQMQKTGGSGAPTWSIVGGSNNAWLSISPTGLLSGTPTPAEAGPVSVIVHVEEPTVPSNFAEKTFTFNVVDLGPVLYTTSFEGACPNGWTLAGDWQCGVPSGVGPAAAYSGSQCIATQIAGNYNNSQAWATATATSPDIDLGGTVSPSATFRMWIDTEGSSFDGANLKVSTDGVNYTILNAVTPAYSLTIDGQAAWGGDQSAAGWQLVQADLAAYAGQVIRLRFGFRTDGSVTHAGVYIDDILVTTN